MVGPDVAGQEGHLEDLVGIDRQLAQVAAQRVFRHEDVAVFGAQRTHRAAVVVEVADALLQEQPDQRRRRRVRQTVKQKGLAPGRNRVVDAAHATEGRARTVGRAAFAMRRQRVELGGAVQQMLHDDDLRLLAAVRCRAQHLEAHFARRTLVAAATVEADDRCRAFAGLEPLQDAGRCQRLLRCAVVVDNVIEGHKTTILLPGASPVNGGRGRDWSVEQGCGRL